MAEAALGLAFDKVLKALLDVKDKVIYFNPILNKIEPRLTSLRRTVSEIEGLNRQLEDPVSETQMLSDLLTEAMELLHNCSKVKWWNVHAKVAYLKKLEEWDEKTSRFLRINGYALHLRNSMKIRVQLDRLCSSGLVGSCGAPEAPEYTVGLDVPLEELKRRLLLEDGVPVVVLSAPGGCGKTTLAKKLCHDGGVKDFFRDNIFFVSVSMTPNLEVIVQKMFQHKKSMVPKFQNDDDAIFQLENLLKDIGPDHPILLVLDDVWSGSESLIEKFFFRIERYRILITSRYEFPRFSSTYKLELLSDEDAIDLFRRSAFPQCGSNNIPADLVREIVRGCRGSRLAITVVGGRLRGQPKVIWESTLKKWSEGESLFDSYGDMRICLQTSIDALDKRTHVEECFMDLGLFPEDQRIPAPALMDIWVELYNLDEDGIYAFANIHELASRNLLNLVFMRNEASEIDGYCSEHHFVTQHDMLRDFAIYCSSQNPIEQRKRLVMNIRGNELSEWSIEQIQPFHARLLSISTDETFSSSWCNMLLPEKTASSSWYSFSNMYKSFIYRKYKQLPELEVLILNIRARNYSLPEFMERIDQLKVLIITNYSFCPAELTNFQRLGLLSSLKRLRLENVSVSFLSESRLQFRNLCKISLTMCKIGDTFGNSSVEFAHMFPNLVEIDIHCCSDLLELPEGLCDIVRLKKLRITKCNDLNALPESLGRLTNLEVLRLHCCTSLSGLPDSVGRLHKLRFLDISDCVEMSELPIQIGELCGLEKLDMRGCGLQKLPPSVKDLGKLKEVICDEYTVYLWEPFKIHLDNLKTTVLKEDKNLNWLPNLHG